MIEHSEAFLVKPPLHSLYANTREQDKGSSPPSSVPLKAAAPHLDVEAAQHAVDAQQVPHGVVYVAVQRCVGDGATQQTEGLLEQPQAGLHLLGLVHSLR